MLDMVLLVTAFPYLPYGSMAPGIRSEDFFSCSLGGGGRYFSISCYGARICTILLPLQSLLRSGKGFFWQRGLFRKILFLKILEKLEILEKPQTLENKGESDHFLETLENLEFGDSSSQKTPFVRTLFSSPDVPSAPKNYRAEKSFLKII